MRRLALGLGAVVVAAVAVGVAYIWLSGGSGEPTTELTTPTLADEPGAPSTSSPSTGSIVEPTSSTGVAGSDGARSFVIDPAMSEARFEVDEIRGDDPNQVVGTTSQVAGQVRLDPSAPASAEISDIAVNARTLQTGSSGRDRAMRTSVILDSGSDEHELITFSPTSIEGLPDDVEQGDTVTATVTGDLTIKGTTQTEEFEVEVTWVDDRLEGTASTTVDRTDYEVGIPNIPSVAEVDEEVLVELQFVAVAG